MNARITQNHAMISLFTRALIGTCASFAFFFLFLFSSAFTIHPSHPSNDEAFYDTAFPGRS
jgi:hypothetical protein